MSDEVIKPPWSPNNILNPLIDHLGTKTRVKFVGSCWKQDKITFNHGKTVSIYIIYEINRNFPISSYPALENCLPGAFSLTNNTNDTDEYKYSPYGNGFDRKGKFSVGNGFGKNCKILE